MTGKDLLRVLLEAEAEGKNIDLPIHAAMDRWAFNEMNSVVIDIHGIWLDF